MVGQTGASYIRANKGYTTGKWYWEVEINSYTNVNALMIGIADATLTTYNASSPLLRAYASNTGNKLPEISAYGSIVTTGDVVGIALDLDIGTLEFWKNGESQGVSHTNVNSISGEKFANFTFGTAAVSNNVTYTVNFGATPFKYNIPQMHYSYDGSQYGSINKILLSSSDNHGDVGKIVEIKTDYETKMTSNVIPTPLRASASSIYSATYDAWKAFDGSAGVGYWATLNTQWGWVQIDYGLTKKVNFVKITADTHATISKTASPKRFNIEGSVDGIVWSVLKKLDEEVNWTQNETREYKFDNHKEYEKYRINVLENNGYTYLSIGEVRFGYHENIMVKTPNKTEQSFINHGMSQSDLESIDMSTDFTEKHYIQDVSVSLGEGKVFEQSLDTSKIIKKIRIS
jgi:hypothetical protein